MSTQQSTDSSRMLSFSLKEVSIEGSKYSKLVQFAVSGQGLATESSDNNNNDNIRLTALCPGLPR